MPATGLPTVDRYIGRLPKGLDSYPQMLAKASVLRTITRDLPGPMRSGIPARLDALIRSPPPANDWIREVEFWAVHLCVYDSVFADKGGVEAWTQWTYDRNRKLLGGPLYKVLFAVLSPERIFVGAADRYAAFHRGTLMSQVHTMPGSADFKLVTPPHAFPDLAPLALAAAFKAALDLSGARSAVVTPTTESPELIAFSAIWSR